MDGIPFTPVKNKIEYQANEQGGCTWIADIGQDKNRPRLFYIRKAQKKIIPAIYTPVLMVKIV